MERTYQNVSIKSPSDLKNRPSISLQLLVKNGVDVVPRLIDNVGPYIREIVAVIDDSYDDTAEALTKKAEEYGLAIIIYRISPVTEPFLYLLDDPYSYTKINVRGDAIEFDYAGPFTISYILADFARARNEGWAHPSDCQWKLIMDADDVMEDPENLPGACQILEEVGADIATSDYEVLSQKGNVVGRSFRERLVKNVPYIKWDGKIHEVLRGQKKTAHFDDILRVVDRRDGKGKGIKTEDRNFKVMWYAMADSGYVPKARDYLLMGRDISYKCFNIAYKSLRLAAHLSTWMEEKSWALSLLGQLLDRRGRETKDLDSFGQAVVFYDQSLCVYPYEKTACLQALSYASMDDWKNCIKSYENSVWLRGKMSLLDHSPVVTKATKMVAATAYKMVGNLEMAKMVCEECMADMPGNEVLQRLHSTIVKQLSIGKGG